MPEGFGLYDVTPDGKRFVTSQGVSNPNTPLTLVQNWTALLGRTSREPDSSVATMKALGGPLSPAFIVGFPCTGRPTTNADSVFVVAPRLSRPELRF